MNWNSIKINKDDCNRLYSEYIETKTFDCPVEFNCLREDIVNLFKKTLDNLNITVNMISQKNYSYKIDYLFGLELYHLLNDKYEMHLRDASSPDVWRFLCLKVVPDIVEMRYGIDHPDRFWKKPHRIWLRSIWWYIYLSWQGNDQDTINAIKDNSTDEIAQLVDRSGRCGYRVTLYREIVKQYSLLDAVERRRNCIFRKMMKLNTARVQVIEPGLVDGGEKEYVNELKNYFL